MGTTRTSYSFNNQKANVSAEEEGAILFKVLKVPSELDQLEIVWNMALHSENPKVIPKAIDFLIKVYSNTDDGLAEQKAIILDELIQKCMTKLQNTDNEATINRIIEIIKNIIYETERKGTGDV